MEEPLPIWARIYFGVPVALLAFAGSFACGMGIIYAFVSPGEHNLWVYLAGPLVILCLNLLWPRKVSVKVGALALLVMAASLHLANASRNLRVVITYSVDRDGERSESDLPPPALPLKDRLQRGFREYQEAANDVWLGFTLGLGLAAVPVNALAPLLRRTPRP